MAVCQSLEPHHILSGLLREVFEPEWYVLWFLQGAMQLLKETEQKLEQAEQQCQDLTKSFFGECRPCLEDSCKAFYTSTCRRGFASFSFKVSIQLISAE